MRERLDGLDRHLQTRVDQKELCGGLEWTEGSFRGDGETNQETDSEKGDLGWIQSVWGRRLHSEICFWAHRRL